MEDTQNKNKVALIFGITGMDGSYLTELLLSKGYEVHGFVRPTSTFNRQRIDHIFDTAEKRETFLHYGDLIDIFSILRVLKKVQPDEVYNLGAQTHVKISWDIPYYTAQTTGIGVLNVLESIRFLELKCKFYQASTSELYSGKPSEAPQDENTRFDPASPYGTAKLYGFQIAKNYRDAFGMFICNGILFNHESKRRGDNFVTKKIINSVKDAQCDCKGSEMTIPGHYEMCKTNNIDVHLGNTDASRDWGWAPEYVEGMWLMMQQEKPDDYVLATGETHTVKEFIDWVKELTGKNIKVVIDNKFVRPQDVDLLCGNPKKAEEKLGWKAKTKGKDLVKEML